MKQFKTIAIAAALTFIVSAAVWAQQVFPNPAAAVGRALMGEKIEVFQGMTGQAAQYGTTGGQDGSDGQPSQNGGGGNQLVSLVSLDRTGSLDRMVRAAKAVSLDKTALTINSATLAAGALLAQSIDAP